MFRSSLAVPGEVGASSSSHLGGFAVLSAAGEHREGVDCTGAVTSPRAGAGGKEGWGGSEALQVPHRAGLQCDMAVPSEM